MRRLTPFYLSAAILLVIGAISASDGLAVPQMPPKALSIVRDDSNSAISIEYLSGGNWQKQPIEANKDIALQAERLRVSTTRNDNAILTVDLPIDGGKKYRVFWNSQASMWDLGGTT